MKRFIMAIMLLWSIPAFASFDSYLGNWVGAGSGSWGHISGYKYVFADGDFVAAEMALENGEIGYSSTLTCFEDNFCSYQDSWGGDRAYTYSFGSAGDITFTWYSGKEFEKVRWFFSKNGSFMEHYVGFLGGKGKSYVMGYSN